MLLAFLLAIAPQDDPIQTCGTFAFEHRDVGTVVFDKKKFSELADAASFVCVGTVDELRTVTFERPVHTVDASGAHVSATALSFGRIRVSQVLKGDPRVRLAYHEVWSLGPQDLTCAWIERPCLFFLAPGVIAEAGPDAFDHATQALDRSLVLRNVFSGQGVLPIERAGDDRFVRVFAPSLMQVGTRIGTAHLAQLSSAIEDLAEFAPDRLTIHTACDATHRPFRSRSKSTETFDLRVLPDGRTRLATYLDDEVVTHGTIDPSKWTSALAVLRDQVGGEDSQYHGPRRYEHARRIVVRTDGHVLTYEEGDMTGEHASEDGRELIVERALRAWAAIAATMDCPTCVDDTADDKRWLDGERTR